MIARLFLGILAVIVTGCGGNSDAPSTSGKPGDAIKIAFLGPLSGGIASSGVDLLNAATLASDEINAAGGVLGRRIELVPVDDACDPQAATAAAQKLSGMESSASPAVTARVPPSPSPMSSTRREFPISCWPPIRP